MQLNEKRIEMIAISLYNLTKKLGWLQFLYRKSLCENSSPLRLSVFGRKRTSSFFLIGFQSYLIILRLYLVCTLFNSITVLNVISNI